MNVKRVLLEVQVHAHDIRRGVRYLFVGPAEVAGIAGAVLLWLALLVAAALLAPRVAAEIASRQEYEALGAARAQQGERLKSLLQRLEVLAAQGEDLQLRMHKVHLAYGLPGRESIGQGGYPFRPQPVPATIYADTIAHGNRLQSEVREQISVVGAFLEEVQAFEEGHLEQVASTPSLCPLTGSDFVLTSPFGTRRNPFTKKMDFHAGVDLAAPVGLPIRAPADGVVVFAGRYDLRQSAGWWRYGNLVVLRHDDRFVTLYGHCQEVEVKRGQAVRQGDVLATVGSTGWSTNPHLHYEVRRLVAGDYRPVDPRIYILDHRWRDEERLLVRGRVAPDSGDYEPLPSRLAP